MCECAACVEERYTVWRHRLFTAYTVQGSRVHVQKKLQSTARGIKNDFQLCNYLANHLLLLPSVWRW